MVFWEAHGPVRTDDPFRHLVQGHVPPDTGTCKACGGNLTYEPKTQENVCTGGTWYCRTDETYQEYTVPGCGRSYPTLNSETSRVPPSGSSYQPMQHFNATVRRLAGYENVEYTPDFLTLVAETIVILFLKAPADVEYDEMLAVIEYISSNYTPYASSFMQHAMSLCNHFRGSERHLLTITPEQEEQLAAYFRVFQQHYSGISGVMKVGRSSHIECSYLIAIFSLMNGYNHILPYLSLIRNPEILTQYNHIMGEICRLAGWPKTRIEPGYLWKR